MFNLVSSRLVVVVVLVVIRAVVDFYSSYNSYESHHDISYRNFSLVYIVYRFKKKLQFPKLPKNFPGNVFFLYTNTQSS